MYAIVETGSKQYKVKQGVEILVEKLDVNPGEAIKLEKVLAVGDDSSVDFGKPHLPITVNATCVGHEKGPKITGVKYKRRKNYRRTFGHRQELTRLLINDLKK